MQVLLLTYFHISVNQAISSRFNQMGWVRKELLPSFIHGYRVVGEVFVVVAGV